MPYLAIRTNQSVEGQKEPLLRKASALITRETGKSEDYVMVSLESSATMLFGGSNEPLAYLELKSLDLPGQKIPALSQALCAFLERETGIPKERIYIEFSSAERSMWGWNGTTF